MYASKFSSCGCTVDLNEMKVTIVVELSIEIHRCALQSCVSGSFDDVYQGKVFKNMKIITILPRT